MHPKSLESLCVDEVVDATVRFQRLAPSAKVWAAVSQVWRDIWQLGGGLPTRAIWLLHANLLCGQQLCRTSLHTGQPPVHDLAPAVVTLLAAKTRTLCLLPVEPQLSRFSPTAAAVVCHDGHPLRELVLTGVDMGSETDFLLNLLPRCTKLSVLKLGGNSSPAVLEAARECPLTVLHVSERMAWQPRMSEECLSKVLTGCEGTSKQLLDDVSQGIPVNLRPSWPNLTDVCTGWCKVSAEFLLLLLVAFPRLQHFSSELFDNSTIVRQYADMAQQVPSLHNLSLRVNSVISGNFSKTYRHYPNATRLHVFNVTDVERTLWELLNASGHLPLAHSLKLGLVHGPLPRPPSPPLREKFIPFGQRITELHLESSHGSWIFALLNLFPAVQHLRIAGNVLQIPEETVTNMVFPSIARLECVCRNSVQLLQFLVAVFPSLESLTLKSQCGILALPWEQLSKLERLREVRLLGTLVDNISGLCCIPRETSDSRDWRLGVVSCSVVADDLAWLRRCGWSCFYVKDYP